MAALGAGPTQQGCGKISMQPWVGTTLKDCPAEVDLRLSSWAGGERSSQPRRGPHELGGGYIEHVGWGPNQCSAPPASCPKFEEIFQDRCESQTEPEWSCPRLLLGCSPVLLLLMLSEQT